MTAGDSHPVRSPVGGFAVKLVVRPASDGCVGRRYPVWQYLVKWPRAAASDLVTLAGSLWARHPGRLASGLRPRRWSDHMLRPATDLNPQVYLHSGLQSLRVVWPGAQGLTGPTSTISWEYRFREWTNPRIVQPVMEFILGWPIPGRNVLRIERIPGSGVIGLQISGLFYSRTISPVLAVSALSALFIRILRPDNLWNAELKRALIIDFHRCTLDRRSLHKRSGALK